jgi:hypothetical protein
MYEQHFKEYITIQKYHKYNNMQTIIKSKFEKRTSTLNKEVHS